MFQCGCTQVELATTWLIALQGFRSRLSKNCGDTSGMSFECDMEVILRSTRKGNGRQVSFIEHVEEIEQVSRLLNLDTTYSAATTLSSAQLKRPALPLQLMGETRWQRA